MGHCNSTPVVVPTLIAQPNAAVSPSQPGRQSNYRVSVETPKDEPAKSAAVPLVNNLFISTTSIPDGSSAPSSGPIISPSSNPNPSASAFPPSITFNPNSHAQNTRSTPIDGALQNFGGVPLVTQPSLIASEPVSNFSVASRGGDSGSLTPADRDAGDSPHWDRAKSLNSIDLHRMMMKRQLSRQRVVDVDFAATAATPTGSQTISGPISAEEIAAAGNNESASSTSRRLTAGGERGKMAELIIMRKKFNREGSGLNSREHSGASSPNRGSIVSRNGMLIANQLNPAGESNSLPADFASSDLSRDQIRRRIGLRNNHSQEFKQDETENISPSQGKSVENTPPTAVMNIQPLAQPQLNRIRSTGRFHKSRHSNRIRDQANSTPNSFNDEVWTSLDSHGPQRSPTSKSSSPTPPVEVEIEKKVKAPNPRRATFAPNHSSSASFGELEFATSTSQPISRRSTTKRSRGKRLALILDSAQVSQQLNSVALYKCGYQVALAENKETAIQLVDDHHYDIILIDFSPIGIEVARAIRDAEDKRGDVPAIMIAQISSSDANLIVECESVGFNAAIERGCAIGQVIPELLDLLSKDTKFLNLVKPRKSTNSKIQSNANEENNGESEITNSLASDLSINSSSDVTQTISATI